MGYGMTILVISLCWLSLIWLIPTTPGSFPTDAQLLNASSQSGAGSEYGKLSAFAGEDGGIAGGFFTQMNSWLANNGALLFGAGLILIGTIIFPNPYTMFIPIVVVLWSFVTSFAPALHGVGGPAAVSAILNLFNIALSILFSIAVVNWWKGGPEF